MQMIFQDLDAALNPKMRIRDILSEAITVHHQISDAEVDKRISRSARTGEPQKDQALQLPP